MNSSRELLQAGRKVRLLAALASVPSAIARSAGARASASTSAGGANARSAARRRTRRTLKPAGLEELVGPAHAAVKDL